MKKVLHVVGKMNIGGTENFLINIHRKIDKSKMNFDYLTYYRENEHGFYDDEIKELGGRIINIKQPSPLKPISSIKRIIDVLNEGNYDAIHTHNASNSMFALLAAKKSGLPIRIAHAHGIDSRVGNKALYLYDAFAKFVINSTLTNCLGCSMSAGKAHFTEKNIEKCFTFIPDAIDFSPYLIEYARDQIRSEYSLGESDIVLIQVGNFKTAKNQLFSARLISELVKRNKRIVLLFAGLENEYAQSVHRYCTESGIEANTRFLGQRDDIPQLLSISDVMIMPSLWEGLGICALEAQASGVPCIVSENVQPEVDLRMGLVKWCSLNNYEEWIDTIESLSQCKHPTIKERTEAIKRSPYQIDTVIKMLEDLYNANNLLGERN